MRLIDLRSDTVTRPSDEMRKVMYSAEVGDDVYNEDKVTLELQEYVAGLFGKEAGLLVPSGVMGNQICLNVHTNPGDEVLCDHDAHIYHYESGSPAALSGIQLGLINGLHGVFSEDQVEPLIRPESAYYMPRTKLIEIENTHNRGGGTIFPVNNIISLRNLADRYGLKMHLDGARIWNAHVETEIPLDEYGRYFESASVCLSKGLGAPIGSVIVGDKDFIKEAFRVRKGWGGGMRQTGIIASAGLYAVKHNIHRLKDDHIKARQLAEYLGLTSLVEISPDLVHTNIIMFRPLVKSVEEVIAAAEERGLLLSTGAVGYIRAVTHLDVSFEDISAAVEVFSKILE